MNHHVITPHHAPGYSARHASTGRCHRKCCWTPYGHRDAPYCTCHVPDDPPTPATPEEIAERVNTDIKPPSRGVRDLETSEIAQTLIKKHGGTKAAA